MNPTPSSDVVADEAERARIDDVLLWRWQRGSQMLLIYLRPQGDGSVYALIETAQRASRLATVRFDSAQAFARWVSAKEAKLSAGGWRRVSG